MTSTPGQPQAEDAFTLHLIGGIIAGGAILLLLESVYLGAIRIPSVSRLPVREETPGSDETVPSTDSSGQARLQRKGRLPSALWTAFLIPFLFLPYRWLWLPCALAGTALIGPSKRSRREVVRRHQTLIFGSLIVLVAQTALDPTWWAPWVIVMAALYWLRGRAWWTTRLSVASVPLAWLAAVCLLARPNLSWRTPPQGSIGSDAVLVCAGDSLTSGVDIESDAESYVARLRGRLPCRVINAGRANDKTADLLARLDKTVLAHKPTVALVFIGGNDFLDGTPRSKFAARLDAVVSRIAATGARIVLVEVPTGIVWNPYAGVYRRVAARYGATLVPETKLRLWFSAELAARDHLKEPLTIDGIHLSPAGATRVADWLEPYVRTALGVQ